LKYDKKRENLIYIYIYIYIDLIIKIHRLWNVKAQAMPVITGSTGTPQNHLEII